MALLFFPIVFGPVAIILGTAAVIKDDSRGGLLAIGAGAFGGFIGWMLGMMVWANMAGTIW